MVGFARSTWPMSGTSRTTHPREALSSGRTTILPFGTAPIGDDDVRKVERTTVDAWGVTLRYACCAHSIAARFASVTRGKCSRWRTAPGSPRRSRRRPSEFSLWPQCSRHSTTRHSSASSCSHGRGYGGREPQAAGRPGERRCAEGRRRRTRSLAAPRASRMAPEERRNHAASSDSIRPKTSWRDRSPGPRPALEIETSVDCGAGAHGLDSGPTPTRWVPGAPWVRRDSGLRDMPASFRN